MEEKEEEREERSDDFLSGTGGFDLPSARDESALLLRTEDEDKEREGDEVVGGGGGGGGGGRSMKEPGLDVNGEEGVRGEEMGVPGVGVLDWLEYPLEGEARRCSPEEASDCWVNVSPSSSKPGDPGANTWEWAGLVGWGSEGGASCVSGCKGSKVVTVPQLSPLCRLLVLVRGTQGS